MSLQEGEQGELREQVGAKVQLLPILGVVTDSGAPWVEGLVVLDWVVFGLSH